LGVLARGRNETKWNYDRKWKDKNVLKLRQSVLKVIFFAFALLSGLSAAQQPDASDLVRRIDAANQARYDHVLAYTVTEHYTVVRGNDPARSAAEMTVLTTYHKATGKSYTIQAQSGSSIILRLGLRPLLDNEKAINNPATVQNSWFSSANYDMKLKAEPQQRIRGRDCVPLAITPKRKAPNMVEGTLWIDPRDGTIAQVEGIASKRPNPFAGTTHLTRQYANINGYAMATHARAESHSALIGRIVVLIDYSDYHFQMAPER
jgi:outer membrane lipoprotein-sorting protein